jgi:hypothetical protein
VDVFAQEQLVGDIVRELRTTPLRYYVSFTEGTAATQAQVVWGDSRTLASGSETLTFSTIADTRDGAAVTINFSAVKAVVVRNSHATHSVTFSGAFTAWPIKPGGMVVIVDPSADGVDTPNLVVSGTAGVTYDIIIIGEGTVT